MIIIIRRRTERFTPYQEHCMLLKRVENDHKTVTGFISGLMMNSWNNLNLKARNCVSKSSLEVLFTQAGNGKAQGYDLQFD